MHLLSVPGAIITTTPTIIDPAQTLGIPTSQAVSIIGKTITEIGAIWAVSSTTT